ncbi:MAG: UDP-N-acetylmuramyl pentapeptide phosphotransferase [Desulforegulaceae bacterium]|nr:UDP-N-acetylmuramyl pentapeptide phosphotransferase [Desulforegulaceae bacterium]
MELSIFMICIFVPLFFGILGAFFIKRFGYKLGLIDTAGERSSHEGKIPKAGGIGIVISFVVCSLYLKIPYFFLIPAVFLSFISFCNDLREIKPKYRLLIHFFCSFVFLIGFIFFSGTCFFSNFWFIPILAVFIAGTANFYNFMDGINGIAAITGVVAFFFLGIYSYIFGFQTGYTLLFFSIMFSYLGFLPFNIPRASVFMGDVGSIFSGFIFACSSILLSENLTDFFCICGFIFLFYADELSTMFIRLKEKESLVKPHRKHLYQVLVNELGFSHFKISFFFGIIQFIISVLIINIKVYGIFYILIFYLFIFVIFCFYSFKIRKKAKS